MKVTASYEFDVPDELVKKSIDEKIENCIKADPDIVKIVRCKDCKNRYVVEREDKGKVVERVFFCDQIDGVAPDNWFCAGGERRPEDEEQS